MAWVFLCAEKTHYMYVVLHFENYILWEYHLFRHPPPQKKKINEIAY
jgi:hypothetical protein